MFQNRVVISDNPGYKNGRTTKNENNFMPRNTKEDLDPKHKERSNSMRENNFMPRNTKKDLDPKHKERSNSMRSLLLQHGRFQLQLDPLPTQPLPRYQSTFPRSPSLWKPFVATPS